MTAAEARKLTEANSTESAENKAVVPLLAIVYEAIYKAAEKGLSTLAIKDAFSGLRTLNPTDSEILTILRFLREDGYQVEVYQFGSLIEFAKVNW